MGFDDEFDEDFDEDFDEELDEDLDEDLDERIEEPTSKAPTEVVESKTPAHRLAELPAPPITGLPLAL
ncbi:MAG: hypothetical protein ACFFBK_06540, partial [Promethearchaeota archaeon]